MKQLSKKDEEQRRSMSDFKIGELVFDQFNAHYSIIKGFKTPWIYILECCEPDKNRYNEKTYKVHFTELESVSKADLEEQIQAILRGADREVTEWRRIAKLGGFII